MLNYLDGSKAEVQVTSSNPTTLNYVLLLGGDTDPNEDGTVNIFDMASIGGQFGQAVTPGSLRDINADGMIDIFDIALAAGNFGQSEPVPWN